MQFTITIIQNLEEALEVCFSIINLEHKTVQKELSNNSIQNSRFFMIESVHER